MSLVGAKVLRKEDPRLLTGSGQFVDDLAPTGCLFASFVTSTEAHARITAIDVRAALATEGAYVPAGIGALDLKSIYEAHIAPLVRGRLDDRGHAVRREGFQWAVLAGLLFLVASIVVGSGSVKAELRSAPEARLFRKAGLLLAGKLLSGYLL